MIKNKWNGNEFPVDEILLSSLNDTDKEYHKLLIDILKEGIWKENRTGVKTLSIFGPQVKFTDVVNKFPLLTTKKVHLKSIIGELLWFIEGSTDKNRLKEVYGTSIWDEWNAPNPKFNGDMGPIYGNQWVNWEFIDEKAFNTQAEIKNRSFIIPKIKKSINQLQNIIDTLKTNPDDRRMIVSAWHVEQLNEMALPPCHWSYQFYTAQYPNEEKRRLHIKMNIRSWDVFLGGPFNIASYAILLLMMAQEVNMIPGDLIISAGDAHLYENHLEYIFQQLKRDSKGNEPVMLLNKNKGFWKFTPEDFSLINYEAHSNWKNVPIAI